MTINSSRAASRNLALEELCAYFGKQCGMSAAEYRRQVQTRTFATVTNEKNSRGSWETVSHPMPDDDLLCILQAAKRFGIEPLNREIYPYRSRDGRIVPTLSVDGWLHFVNTQPDYDGFEAVFSDEEVPVPGSKLKCAAWCEVRLFRKSLKHPVVVREYTEEVIRAATGRDGRVIQTPWQQWPRRMLRHRTFVQAARYAFPCAGLGIVGSDGEVEDEREGDEIYLGDLSPEEAETVREAVGTSGPEPQSDEVPPAVPQRTAPEPEPKPVPAGRTSGHASDAERGKAEDASGTANADGAAGAENDASVRADAIRQRYNLADEKAFRTYLLTTFERGIRAGRSRDTIARWILGTWRGDDQAFAVALWNAFISSNAAKG